MAGNCEPLDQAGAEHAGAADDENCGWGLGHLKRVAKPRGDGEGGEFFRSRTKFTPTAKSSSNPGG
jgi:hypothetical protein